MAPPAAAYPALKQGEGRREDGTGKRERDESLRAMEKRHEEERVALWSRVHGGDMEKERMGY